MVLVIVSYNLTFGSPSIISTIIPHLLVNVKEKMYLSEINYTAKDSPQPQEATAFGFITFK